MNPRVFREYDIRGKADTDLDDPFAEDLGRAFGTTVRRNGGRFVALGRDCRVSGPRIFKAFEKGVRSTGVDTVDIGVVPTPVLYFAIHRINAHGGVIVTGSHNPGDENGFKLCLGTDSMYGDALQGLRRLIEARDFEMGSGRGETRDMASPYTQYIRKSIRPGRPLKVVIDAGNGTGGYLAGPIYRLLGHEVIELHCEMDGTFPNHHPDPTVEANLADLKAAVAEHQADVGIAFDGDADRLGAVDHTGRVAWGDQLLLFFARALLAEQPGASIVAEVKCSRVLFDDLRARGGKPEMWKVGHSLIKARMKETGALLAGEMSGHLFFRDRFLGFDDGLYAGARLLELLSTGTERLADLLDGLPPTVTTPELRVTCPDDAKVGVVARAAADFARRYPVNTIDGMRVDFPHGWGLLRASNTGPVLVMRFEADTAEAHATYRGEVEGWLRKNAPQVDLGAGPQGH